MNILFGNARKAIIRDQNHPFDLDNSTLAGGVPLSCYHCGHSVRSCRIQREFSYHPNGIHEAVIDNSGFDTLTIECHDEKYVLLRYFYNNNKNDWEVYSKETKYSEPKPNYRYVQPYDDFAYHIMNEDEETQ